MWSKPELSISRELKSVQGRDGQMDRRTDEQNYHS